MKKSAVILIFLICFTSLSFVIAEGENSESQKQKAIAEAEALKANIISECEKDAYECSCQRIPCNDLLEVENEQAQQAYDKCIQEREKCEEQRKKAIEEMEKLKEEISNECKKDLNSCDCDEIENEEAKSQCELEIINAKYEAEKQKQEKIQECMAELETCDCDEIENKEGKKECKEKLQEAKALKEKIKSACEKDLGACSCVEIESEEGRSQCEQERKQAQKQAGEQVAKILFKCFKNVDECDCSNLGLEKQEYIDFCEVEKSYGISCRDEGLHCDDLETMSYVPYGLPEFLAPIFEKTYKNLIEKEKQEGAKKGAKIMENCISYPVECNCNLAPSYAVDFCEHKRDLQIKCLENNYEACLILDEEPNLPEGMPEFSRGMFEKIAQGLRNAQEGIVKTRATKRVGNMIVECMDDSEKCDCSIAPKGEWKAFCEHKKELIEKCRDKKHYESCFTLDEEPLVTEDMPNFIKDYINNNIAPEVETKKKQIYDEMKIGTVCENIETLEECKTIMR